MRSYLFLFLCLVLVFGCGEKESPQKAVTESFEKAMNALNAHQFEEYFECVDYGCKMDSVQRDVLIKTYAQHQDMQEQERGTIHRMTVVDVAFSSDTVCDIYYELQFSDSVCDVFSQKMVKIGDVWKIRARN